MDSKPVKYGVYIHTTKPLDRLINGPKSEAQSGEAGLEEVMTRAMFVRFCYWAYFMRASTPLLCNCGWSLGEDCRDRGTAEARERLDRALAC